MGAPAARPFETRQLDGYRRDADGLFRAEQPDIYRMISAL